MFRIVLTSVFLSSIALAQTTPEPPPPPPEPVAEEAADQAAEATEQATETATDAATTEGEAAAETVAEETPAAPATPEPPATPTDTDSMETKMEIPPSDESKSDITRSGVYWGFQFGAGFSNLAPEAIAGGFAGTFGIRLGFSPIDQLATGVELQLLGQFNGTDPGSHVYSSYSSVLAEATYWPLLSYGLNLTAGLGWSSGLAVARLSTDSFIASKDNGGFAWKLGVGYDFFPGDGFNAGLLLRYDGVRFSKFDTTSSTGSLALALTWY